MKYPVAERFKAVQGEGSFAGTPMAFIRLVGCSVGQGVCHACDTDFDRTYQALGGGMYTAGELADWARPYRRACLTGGEPLDRDLRELILALTEDGVTCHVETSGTVHPAWLDPKPRQAEGQHAFGTDLPDGRVTWRWLPLWLAVSPKPGWRTEMVVDVADEVKVILGGLGDGPGWPTLEDAVRWADEGKTVFVQPRNLRLDVDRVALSYALAAVDAHPQLRLSAQLHKFLGVR